MEEAARHISRYFGHIANQYQAYREKRVSGYGIGRSDFNILHQLILHERPMHLGEIAKRTRTDRALIGRSAKHLLKLGYIAVQDNPFHKTKKDMVLTESGREVALAVKRATEEWEREAEKYLTPEDRATFYDLLAKVSQASEEMRAQDE